jgi:hypothetical protein
LQKVNAARQALFGRKKKPLKKYPVKSILKGDYRVLGWPENVSTKAEQQVWALKKHELRILLENMESISFEITGSASDHGDQVDSEQEDDERDESAQVDLEALNQDEQQTL